MNAIFKTFTAILAVCICSQTFAQSGGLHELFEARKNCVVQIKYITQQEEYREQCVAQGVVVDASGLVAIPFDSMDRNLPVRMMKDFKLYTPGGDTEGYKCEYLGNDPVYGLHFVKISGEAPKNLMPYTAFGRGEVKIADNIWGIGIIGEVFSYDACFMNSKVRYVIEHPYRQLISVGSATSSGGPLFTEDGKFLGMGVENTVSYVTIQAQNDRRFKARITDSWLTDTILGAECIDEAAKMIPSNPDGDPHAYLGVMDTQMIKRDVAKFLGFKDGESGISVGGVVEGSAADKCGIKKGDIIVGLNSKRFKNTNPEYALGMEFSIAIRKMKIGDTLKIDVIKEGKSEMETLEAVLAASPKSMKQAQSAYFPRLGLSVREFVFDDASSRRILNGTTKGAVIRWVKPNGPAASATPARVYAFDWVKEINSEKIDGYESAVKILSEIEKDESAKEVVLMVEGTSETRVARVKLN